MKLVTMKLWLSYPDELRDSSRLTTKLAQILSRFQQISLYYQGNNAHLLKPWADSQGYRWCQLSAQDAEGYQSISHAVIFDDGQQLPLIAQFKALGTPLRVINTPVTRVANLDRQESYDVYAGRGSPFGNPYALGIDGDREEVIRKFAYDFHRGLLSDPKTQTDLRQLATQQLVGKVIGCHCKPAPCHADVIAAYLNGEPAPF